MREALARESPGDPDARRGLAESRYHLGALLARTPGPRARGRADLPRGRATSSESLVAEARGRPELRADLARSLNNLGLLLADDGRDAEAQAAFREAAAIAGGARRGPDPGAAGHRWQRARALEQPRGPAPGGRTGPTRPRRPSTRRATLLEALAADFPAVPDYRRDLASVHNNLGLL